MTKKFLLFCLSSFLLLKISHAKYNKQDWPNVPPTLRAKSPIPPPTSAPTPKPTNAPTFDRIAAKCYPETATAYFIPAPPTPAKITVLNPNSKDLPASFNQKPKEIVSVFKEVPSSPSSMPFPPSVQTHRAAFPPPPPCLTGLPDLIDEIPTKIQDGFSRLAESEEKPVCESCASLLKKLPIFNFDQELLDGFLAGICL